MKKTMYVLLLSILAISCLLLTSKEIVGTVNASSTSYDYVIITINDIVAHSDRLQGFVRLKERFGYSVKVVTETDFDGLVGQPPNGRPEKIRQWLINNYVSLSINQGSYVLLIGNPDPEDPTDPSDFVGDIPMKMCWPSFIECEGRNYPTDFFYADLTGNWDLDGDLYFGESTKIDNAVINQVHFQTETPSPSGGLERLMPNTPRYMGSALLQMMVSSYGLTEI